MSRRRAVLPAASAALAVTLAAVFGGCAGPGSPGGQEWTGGPVTPTPITVTVNPSALPRGDTMPTGIVVAGHELILYFWGAAMPYLTTVWRDVNTNAVSTELDGVGGISAAPTDPAFMELRQLVAGDGTLIEYGAVRGPVARVVCQDKGASVQASFTTWSEDRAVTVFWLRRSGTRVPDNTPSGPGSWVPLEPERYPLVTVYRADGSVLAAARIRPPGMRQKSV